jgi:hypothetical protein
MAEWRKYGENRHRPPGEWVQTTVVEEVWGINHRMSDAKAFCRAVELAERASLTYGVALAPEPTNRYDPNAIAVLGQCMVKRFFGSPKLQEWHIGYVQRDLARELHEDLLSKGIAVASELYRIFEQDDYLEVKFIVLAPPGHGHKVRLRGRHGN